MIVQVDVLCRGEVLGKEYTLEYVLRTRWRKPSQLMLQYRPSVDVQATTPSTTLPSTTQKRQQQQA